MCLFVIEFRKGMYTFVKYLPSSRKTSKKKTTDDYSDVINKSNLWRDGVAAFIK